MPKISLAMPVSEYCVWFVGVHFVVKSMQSALWAGVMKAIAKALIYFNHCDNCI
jgi:hypothetical protein